MGAGATLNLKQRAVKGSVQIGIDMLRSILASGNRENLWTLLEQVSNQPSVDHDKRWLEAIANWTPQGGLSIKDQVKWLGLITRVEKLDDTREGSFNLNAQQVELIWARLQKDDFKQPASPQFSAFLIDFLRAAGKQFPEYTEGDWEDPDPVKGEDAHA